MGVMGIDLGKILAQGGGHHHHSRAQTLLRRVRPRTGMAGKGGTSVPSPFRNTYGQLPDQSCLVRVPLSVYNAFVEQLH